MVVFTAQGEERGVGGVVDGQTTIGQLVVGRSSLREAVTTETVVILPGMMKGWLIC